MADTPDADPTGSPGATAVDNADAVTDTNAAGESQQPKKRIRNVRAGCRGDTAMPPWPPEYEMTCTDARYRGHVVIISNKKFINLPCRNGTENDVAALQECFEDAFGFDKKRISVFTDQSASEMTKLMVHKVPYILKEEYKYFPPDCFVCVILTHGDANDLLYGVGKKAHPNDSGDDGTVNLDDLIKPIQDCDALVGKPKIFIIQACKGDGTDEAKQVTASLMQKGPCLSRSGQQEVTTCRIPSRADTVVLYATSEGHKAWKNVNGSFFIQNFCGICCEEVLPGQKRAQAMEFLHLSTCLNNRLAYEYEINTPLDPVTHGKKQMPFVASTLTKFLYFNKFPRVENSSLQPVE